MSNLIENPYNSSQQGQELLKAGKQFMERKRLRSEPKDPEARDYLKHDIEGIDDRVKKFLTPKQESKLKQARKCLAKRMIFGSKFKPEDMGKLQHVALGDVGINIIIQRDVDMEHVNKLISQWDPIAFGIVQLLQYMEEEKINYTFTCFDAQHRLLALYFLVIDGKFEGYDESNWQDYPVNALVFDADAINPVNNMIGEAKAQSGYLTCNGLNLQQDPYYIFRGHLNNYDRYNGKQIKDEHASFIHHTFRKNGLQFCVTSNKDKDKGKGDISIIDNFLKSVDFGLSSFSENKIVAIADFLKKSGSTDRRYGICGKWIMAVSTLINWIYQEDFQQNFNWDNFALYYNKYDVRGRKQPGLHFKKLFDTHKKFSLVYDITYNDKIGAMMLLYIFNNDTANTENSKPVYKFEPNKKTTGIRDTPLFDFLTETNFHV